MAELRPWIGADISLGQFKLIRDVRIAHCWIEDHQRARLFVNRGVPPEDWDKSVWEDIDRAFSRPIVPNDDEAHYVPTQIVAELFKTNSYDGIVYRSGVRRGGHNLVLFDPAVANLQYCTVFDLRNITFEFKEAANPYFCRDAEETLP